MHALITALIVLTIYVIRDLTRIKNVLVVEDSPIDRLYIQKGLRVSHVKLHFCSTYDQAIRSMMYRKYHYGVFDQMLPDCTGDKLYKLFRERGIPARIMTAHEGDIKGVPDEFIIRKNTNTNLLESIKNFIQRYTDNGSSFNPRV